jgi:outer membrane protein assembly factor BamB
VNRSAFSQQQPDAARPGRRRTHWAAHWAIALLALLTALPLAGAAAQTDSRPSSYWQFAASTRLDSVVLADIDADGVAEIIVLDENGRLTLLAADGRQLWSFLSPDPVAAVGAAAVDSGLPQRSIAVAAGQNLILLDAEGEERWRRPLDAATAPAAIAAYDFETDGDEDILVMLASGHLSVYSGAGDLLWQFAAQEDATLAANPQLLVADFEADGVQEIALGLFTPRRFSQLVFLRGGIEQWRQSVSRRITTVALAPFDAQATAIAVGTNFGQLNLYAPDGQLLWFRTVNRPISALAFTDPPDAPVLAVGTTTGSVVAFSGEGRRLWSSNLARDADRQVLALLPAGDRALTAQSSLAAILEPASDSSEMADILLLGNNGQTLANLNDTDLPQMTRLVDINKDGHYELLLGRFATLQLLGLGIGDSEYVQEWEYALDAAPSAVLVLDLDEDGEDEIIVGTRDGRVHSLSADRTIRWLNAPGEEIAFLARARYALSEPPRVAVVRRQRPLDESAPDTRQRLSWLELREATGERLWATILNQEVTSLVVDDRNADSPAIILGTSTGQVLAYDFDGNALWSHPLHSLEGGVRHLIIDERLGNLPDHVFAVGQNAIADVTRDEAGVTSTPFAAFDQPIAAVYNMRSATSLEPALALVVFLEDGAIHGLSSRGEEMERLAWPLRLGSRPSATDVSGEGAIEAFQENVSALLVATDDGRLRQVTINDDQPLTSWQLNDLGAVQAVAWDDLDKDGRPDTGLVGTRDGSVWLYDRLYTRAPQRILELPLASGVFHVALLKRASSQSPDILTITQNGLVRLFREEENRPPLLTQPGVESEGGQVTIGVQVADVENDAVTVQLELQDPADGSWLPEEEQQLVSGNGRLVWPAVTIPPGTERIVYRFRFSDGFYRGTVSPPAGPTYVAAGPGLNRALGGGAAGLLLIAGLFLFARQAQTPAAQAARFHRQIGRHPSEALLRLEAHYAAVGGSPDFLLQLANRARQTGDMDVANLADGLFLLPNRPQAGLSIITRTLDDIHGAGRHWVGLAARRLIYKTCQALLEAPSVTELGLLRPQLDHLLTVLNDNGTPSPIFDNLLPVITNMRDSERVEMADDRLVYLNQAGVRLRQLQEQLDALAPSVERTLARGIARRWAGLLTAEIEEQRGRAELQVALMTKRLAPNGQTHVALEIRNTGRAAAENVVATLDDNPAYRVHGEPQMIPFLPSGRSRQVRFLIEPQAETRFRVGLSLTYDDRSRRDRALAFGDMVNLLPPVREYTPIANPYLPGTALRKDSPLFFGREELFDFIAEHAGAQRQRNVLMLVGQRRTGKTSVLLRLEEYLPPSIVPVYIDCQSLGVSPGMPALLQEFAWHIADTLSTRGLDCPVADSARWQDDPASAFHREFLPSVRRLLPPEATLLLVFDEFEAFESMVADGILPRTFFPYMRHLMQHSTGLGFVFVGTRRLEEMSADYWSVLFNVALYRKIDFLSEAAAIRLICEPVAPHIVYDDLALDKILRVTAGHPYFLQLVCYTLVKQANQQKTGYVTISDVNVALDEMLRLGEVHFAYLWQRSSHAERALLAAAAHLSDRNEPLHPETFIDYLQPYSIELDPTEMTEALGSLVARDIMREVTEEGKALYELRIGLVGLWVARNKSLSRLHAHLES